MALWTCRRCTTAFAVGLPYCPNCTGTDIERDDEQMAKITVHGGASNADELAQSAPAPASDLNPADEVGQDPAPASDTERYESLTVVELRQLIHARNNQRSEDDQLTVSGNKAELVQRLLDDDQGDEGD